MSRQFSEIVPRREHEPQRDLWFRTVTRRTGNWCNAANSKTRGGSSFAANLRRMFFDCWTQIGRCAEAL